MLINYRLNQYELEKPKKAEQLGNLVVFWYKYTNNS